MPFVKGKQKTGGRQKGTSNRKVRDAEALAAQYDYDPIEALIVLAEKSRDENIQLTCHKELAKYLYAQKRTIELSGPNGEPMKHEIESSETKEIMAEFKKFINNKIVDERKD